MQRTFLLSFLVLNLDMGILLCFSSCNICLRFSISELLCGFGIFRLIFFFRELFNLRCLNAIGICDWWFLVCFFLARRLILLGYFVSSQLRLISLDIYTLFSRLRPSQRLLGNTSFLFRSGLCYSDL